MDFITIVLLSFNIVLMNADNFQMAYRMYLGSPDLDKPISLIVKCAREMNWTGVGLSLDPVSRECNSMSKSWLALKQTEEGVIYLENTIRSQEFLPPKYLHSFESDQERYEVEVPIDIRNGSSIAFYINILNLNLDTFGVGILVQITFHTEVDQVLRTTLAPERSQIECVSMYNETATDTMYIDREIALNKTEKFTFRVVKIGGFEIYHNDELVGVYSDDRTPYSTYGFGYVSIIMGPNTYKVTPVNRVPWDDRAVVCVICDQRYPINCQELHLQYPQRR